MDKDGKVLKYDKGKAPVMKGFLRYFPRAIEAVSRVSEFGANKYIWGGWQDIEPQKIEDAIDRYSEAYGRHILKEGIQEFDEETGLQEAAHQAWNSMARLELMLRKKANEAS